MFYFNNDYLEGCHPSILKALADTNFEQTPGYGEDIHCARAAAMIREKCGREDLAVHFLVGGTQANLTVIAAALRPHQGTLCAQSGHIEVHETGAVEATGHKVLTLPSSDGKITAGQIAATVRDHREDASFEHMVQPKLIYISHPTEYGTLYSKAELEEISAVCRENGLYLFLDGARLGYGIMASGSDLSLVDIARLCDVFYIGGTKVGALFGEAVVIGNPALKEDFRYLIKQRGGMLAKGRLLGLQFEALLRDDLYFSIARQADEKADRIRAGLAHAGVPLQLPGITNQIFAVFPDEALRELEKKYVFCPMGRADAGHSAVRICTSWATTEEAVDSLCADLLKVHN